jgi:predicted dehydrogenase
MSPLREPSTTVNVGVVGCGWWATTAHLPAIVDHPQARLAAIAEPNDEKRARAAERFGVSETFGDWSEMLDAVALDAVIVATGPQLHHAPAAGALERGVHVLVEKPMVVSPEEGRDLLRLSQLHGAHLSVGYTFQHTKQVIALREAIAEGRIGTVQHVSCTFASIAVELYRGRPEAYRDNPDFPMLEVPDSATYSDPGGGQATSQLTHSAALALHLSGLTPREVSAAIANFELPVDLADALAITFTSGAVGTLDSVGSLLPGQQEILQCRVFGEKGHVQLDAIAGEASIHAAGTDAERLPPLAASETYPIAAPAENLVGVVLGEEPNRAPGTLGQQVVELLDAAFRSARDGRATHVGADGGPR